MSSTTQIKGDVAEQINKLKQQPGKDRVTFGSPGLAKSLLSLELVDAHKLTPHPVIPGEGISLFDSNKQMSSLKSLQSQTPRPGTVTSLRKANQTSFSQSDLLIR